ncbi:helix-turn-helix domain-containing protein [Virgisporangium ochraceum]|uniref:helix-turn-helix domain-containing protein n=1 Tax=Virgisporangium ochraceum TaxID=65505 RepID=UPI001EF2951F|nr:helix-turn-helix domain-containing protein [Virgisporangium ochraceum]
MNVHRIEPLWTVEDVSAFLGVPVNTLYQWRHRRTGPRASRVGRHLRYDPADVRAWFSERAA